MARQLKVNRPTLVASLEVGGKRLSNKKMRATGFILKYANYQLGYSEILKSEVLNNG